MIFPSSAPFQMVIVAKVEWSCRLELTTPIDWKSFCLICQNPSPTIDWSKLNTPNRPKLGVCKYQDHQSIDPYPTVDCTNPNTSNRPKLGVCEYVNHQSTESYPPVLTPIRRSSPPKLLVYPSPHVYRSLHSPYLECLQVLRSSVIKLYPSDVLSPRLSLSHPSRLCLCRLPSRLTLLWCSSSCDLSDAPSFFGLTELDPSSLIYLVDFAHLCTHIK